MSEWQQYEQPRGPPVLGSKRAFRRYQRGEVQSDVCSTGVTGEQESWSPGPNGRGRINDAVGAFDVNNTACCARNTGQDGGYSHPR